MKPIVLTGSILEKLSEPVLKPGAIRSSVECEARFAAEIRQHLSFLFDEYGGEIVPDATVKYPRPFDFASVIVAVDDLLFRFFRGRGDLRAWIAPKREPSGWSELHLVIATIDDGQPSAPLFLDDVRRLLRGRMIRLREAFSEDGYPDLKRRLSALHEHERVAIRAWETETNRRLYPDK